MRLNSISRTQVLHAVLLSTADLSWEILVPACKKQRTTTTTTTSATTTTTTTTTTEYT
jgi:hypothetical protein